MGFSYRVLFFLATTAVLFSLRDWVPVGADGPYMASLVETQAIPLYYRSLLTLWIHKLVYNVGEPFGFDGRSAIALSSAFAGAIAVQGLWALCPRVLFVLVTIPTGAFLVFCGHVENYAWVNCFFILTMWASLRLLQNRTRMLVVVVLYMLACLAHMLAIFYLPAMIYLWTKVRRGNPLEILVPVVCFALIVVASGLSGRIGGTEIGLERLVPIGETWAPNHYFTFLSNHHIEMLFYFHVHAGWMGVPLAWPLLFLVLLRYVDSVFERFLLLTLGCGVVWTTIWHPDWGAMDWDLFSQVGIPLHIMTGWLLCKRLCPLPDNESS